MTPKQEQAALLLAEDRLPDRSIAARVGIDTSTLTRWKRTADFAERRDAIRAELRAAALTEAIADKSVRLRDYEELRRRLWGTIEARAESGQKVKDGDEYGRKPAPGVEQGLMVRKITPTRTGFIEEWAVDTAVIAEIRNLDKQAAQEMGDWTEKRELSGNDGGPVRVEQSVNLADLTDEEFAAAYAIRRRLAGLAPTDVGEGGAAS